VKARRMNLSIIIFILLFLMSPTPWTLLFNFSRLSKAEINFYKFNSPVFISEINFTRGQIKEAGIAIYGKIFINKFTYFMKDAGQRYLESFDSHFLFTQGDLSIEKSTRNSGPIYWIWLPFLGYGFYLCYKNRSKILVFVLLLPILGILIREEYETFSRLPFIIGMYYIVGLGVTEFFNKKKYYWTKALVLILLVFEYSRFLHYLLLHYPYLVGRY